MLLCTYIEANQILKKNKTKTNKQKINMKEKKTILKF